MLQWFKGGKTNICYNSLDRHVDAGLGDKIAFFWEGNDPGVDDKLTYKELLERVCQVLTMCCFELWACRVNLIIFQMVVLHGNVVLVILGKASSCLLFDKTF